MADGLLTLFLCGDVMLGRGVDQILPHPGDSLLRERDMDDARHYVRLAELVSGPIPQPASFTWGDALDVLDQTAPDARVINLETSVTRGTDFSPGQGRALPDEPCRRLSTRWRTLAWERPGPAAIPARPLRCGRRDLVSGVRGAKRPADVVVVSIHWGSNWGYQVHPDQVRFARRLIDGGVDLVHGHSSHHPRPAEVYRGKLVLYGCGDFIDDYEGIGGYEEFRDDLRLLYLASVWPETGTLDALRMVPMQASKMRLRHASTGDSEWLRSVLEAISSGFGSRVSRLPDGTLVLRPAPA